MRAFRSVSMSPSSADRRRSSWFIRPRISARLRPTGCASVRTASPTRAGSESSRASVAAADEERVECGAVGALLDSFVCAFHRAVVHGPQGYRWRRMKTRELEYDL